MSEFHKFMTHLFLAFNPQWITTFKICKMYPFDEESAFLLRLGDCYPPKKWWQFWKRRG